MLAVLEEKKCNTGCTKLLNFSKRIYDSKLIGLLAAQNRSAGRGLDSPALEYQNYNSVTIGAAIVHFYVNVTGFI